ncbi:IS481 family transposase [Stenotrophomonas maltophilia]|uniref:IS481-like element ISStma12 family transposase n=1 Tax=Stenotrophomonas maltophilia TaxID=40324 RepID=UPI0021C9D875|nr:IS481-like element ISStma12 family transposase [Stenotrophomonas maltophilia]MCU1204324.1 IS481 family transposase [Stenotrophomonas maltophilia]
MNHHKNARLTPFSRELLVRRITEQGLRPEEAAQACGVSVRTAYKWLARYRAEGLIGLQNRSSRPSRSPHGTPEALVEQIVQRRRQRQTYLTISKALGVAHSTISRLMRRRGLNRLCLLDPPKKAVRYEYDSPGDLLHLDIKKLGNFHRPGHRVDPNRRGNAGGGGWGYVHVAIDDHSRVAFSSVHTDEKGPTACQALLAALAYYKTLGVTFQRVLTDNGACYRSGVFARLVASLGMKHYRTKPYTPRTNGKAERFIQTSLREWAYACEYASSEQRDAVLPEWLHHYNWHRPHMGIGSQPPISRIPLNNVVGLHS